MLAFKGTLKRHLVSYRITGTAKHQSSKLCDCCAVVFRAMAMVPLSFMAGAAGAILGAGAAGKVCIFLHRPTSVKF